MELEGAYALPTAGGSAGQNRASRRRATANAAPIAALTHLTSLTLDLGVRIRMEQVRGQFATTAAVLSQVRCCGASW